MNLILVGSIVNLGFATPGQTGTIAHVDALIDMTGKVLVEGQKMKTGSIAITLTGCTNGIVVGASGAGVLLPLALFVDAEGLFPFRQHDFADILVTGTIPSVGPGSFVARIELLSANQTSVEAE